MGWIRAGWWLLVPLLFLAYGFRSFALSLADLQPRFMRIGGPRLMPESKAPTHRRGKAEGQATTNPLVSIPYGAENGRPNKIKAI